MPQHPSQTAPTPATATTRTVRVEPCTYLHRALLPQLESFRWAVGLYVNGSLTEVLFATFRSDALDGLRIWAQNQAVLRKATYEETDFDLVDCGWCNSLCPPIKAAEHQTFWQMSETAWRAAA